MSGLASAEELTWRVQSSYPYIVHFKLFSQDRNHVWPDTSRVWVLDDYDVHTLPISCQSGEKICYGAWPAGDTSTYWGVSNENDESCSRCCYICDGGQTKIIELLE